MKVKCIANKQSDLKGYEYKTYRHNHFSERFDVVGQYEYPLVIGKEYLIMGMILFRQRLDYLLDADGLILTAPCYLFDISTPLKIPNNWHFRIVGKEEKIYPFIQAFWGYKELCSDKNDYERLIVDMEEMSQQIYFRRKMERLGKVEM